MAKTVSNIEAVCTPRAFLYSTFFSDVYRGRVSDLDGLPATVEAEHIQIPVNGRRREELADRYGLDARGIDGYDRDLAAWVRQAIRTEHYEFVKTRAGDKENGNDCVGLARRILVENYGRYMAEDGDGTCHIFLVTEPTTPLFDNWNFFERSDGDRTIRFTTPYKLGLLLDEFLILIARWSAVSCRMASIPVENLVTVNHNNNKKYRKLSLRSFMYCADGVGIRCGRVPRIPAFPSVMPFNTSPNIMGGGEITEEDPLYSAGAAIMTMLNGSYGFRRPDPGLPPIVPVPDEFEKILRGLLSGDLARKHPNNPEEIARKISSTEIRDLLSSADMKAADNYLPVKCGCMVYADEYTPLPAGHFVCRDGTFAFAGDGSDHLETSAAYNRRGEQDRKRECRGPLPPGPSGPVSRGKDAPAPPDSDDGEILEFDFPDDPDGQEYLIV